jgi:small-conductance mechanosensitive channel
MIDRLNQWSTVFRDGPLARVLIVLVFVMIGYVVGKLASRAVARGLSRQLAPHQAMLARRLMFYLVMTLSILTGFNEAGINLSVLIGAAGVLSVAVGFASQTTMSNMISGVFILIERPFMIGDIIKIGATTGEVSMVGLLSTTLKTPDNQTVRVPNETLMKAEITNTTRFQLRRVDLAIGISYKAPIAKAHDLIKSAIRRVEGVQSTPEPQVLFKSFGDLSMNISADFWVDKNHMGRVTLLVAEAIKDTLAQNGIEIPLRPTN